MESPVGKAVKIFRDDISHAALESGSASSGATSGDGTPPRRNRTHRGLQCPACDGFFDV